MKRDIDDIMADYMRCKSRYELERARVERFVANVFIACSSLIICVLIIIVWFFTRGDR